MSDINPIGETSEVEPIEQVENIETQEQQALEDATFEPEAHVEQTGDIAESEAIETTFVELVENTAANIEPPAVETQPGEVGSGAEGVSATPINLPNPVEEAAAGGVSSGAEGVSATPINLPNPVEETAVGEASSGAEGVSATPINLPNPVEEAAAGGVSSGAEGVSATPINLPNPVEETTVGGVSSGAEGVSATPINLPNPVETQAPGLEADGVERDHPGPGGMTAGEMGESIRDQETGTAGAIQSGESDSQGVSGEAIDGQQIIPGQLPQEAVQGAGMDAQGRLLPGGKGPAGSGKGPQGVNPGMGNKAGGGGKSGGGSGDEDLDALLEWGTKEEIEEWEKGMQERALDIWEMEQLEKDEKGEIPLDEVSTPPYIDGKTGSGGIPQPDGFSGGRPGGDETEVEAGKFFGGVTGSGSKGSGGTPGDPDGEDDSGKFLGDPNLSGGSGGGIFGPDDLDYNEISQQVDILNEKGKGGVQK